MTQPSDRDLAAGFIVIHGNQSETLRDLLCDWMRAHPLAPLENEVILVQSNGIAQWLTLSLASDPAPGTDDGTADRMDDAGSGPAGTAPAGTPPGASGLGHGLGIAAALDIQLPSRFIWQAYRAVLGDDAVPERAPFGKDLLTWRLMRMLPGLLHQEVFASLRRFLEDDALLRRRHQLAAQLADLFDQYQVYRADWLADWADGHDVLRTARAVAPAGAVGSAAALAVAAEEGGRSGLTGAGAGLDADGHASFMSSSQNLHAQTMRQGMPSGVRPVPEESLWQPALWRALLADGDVADIDRNRAAVHERFMAACADPARARPQRLPRRVLVFGISAMPRQSLEVLSALGRWCQVLMCVQNPSRHYWGDIVPERALLSSRTGRHAHRPGFDPDRALLAGVDHGQALLAAWGRQGRDFIGLLADHDEPEAAERRMLSIDRRADVFIDHEPADTLLLQLQQDILDLAPLAETRQRWPAIDPRQDRSIRFQVCHSAQREVEVLHDQLLAAFAADPTLQPRDVIVMVPDITPYAPHIQAVFGLYAQSWETPAPGHEGTGGMHGRRDPRFIPFSMADQQSRAHEPLLAALEMLLGLPQGRVTVADVLDLLDVSAVQRRFGIEPERLVQLRRWIGQSGIRWGLDEAQRQSLELGRMGDQNSWRFGLRRLLLGYAAGQMAAGAGGEEPASDWQGIEPLDEISGLDGELLGRLQALLDALQQAWQTCCSEATPAEWGLRLQALLNTFFWADDGREGLLLVRLNESLQQWLDDCAEARMDLPLPLSVVREHWLASIDEDGLGRRFLAGAVTFATLMPMRAIPFRHVCLLGMNDGDFPRSRQPADFDLMAGDYRPGDRSRREDDRYLFLEALLSARERLTLSWVGRSIHDDSHRPPSVLVAQLRDHIAAGWRLAGEEGDSPAAQRKGGEALLAALTTQHRLQPFSRAYFAGEDGLFSYAREWQQALQQADAARARARLRGEPGAGAAGVEAPRWPLLPPAEFPDELTLADLTSFLKAPVKYFFQKRLGVYWNDDEDVLPDHEPFSLDGLACWKVQDALVKAQLHSLRVNEQQAGPVAWQAMLENETRRDALLLQLVPVRERALAQLARAGALPVGAFGELQRERLEEPLPKMMADYLHEVVQYPRALPDEPFVWEPLADAALPAGFPPVLGTLDCLRTRADGARVRLVLTASTVVDGKGKTDEKAYRLDRLLDHWVYHLAGNLQDGAMSTVLVGKAQGKACLRLDPLPPKVALQHWHVLLEAWQQGLRRPLPLAAKTGFAWLKKPCHPPEAGAEELPSGDGKPSGAGEPSGADEPSDARKNWQDLTQTYEGAGEEGGKGRFGGQGERDSDMYLARAWPDMMALWQAGEFGEWAERLLRPVWDALHRSSSNDSQKDGA